MREILTVQVGGAGIRLGNQFWDYIRTEHGVDHLGVYHGNSHLQLQYIDVYFSDIEMKRHVPRAILVDSGNVTDSTKYNRWQLPMLITLPHVSGSAGTGNVFSHGLLHRSKVVDNLMENFRRVSETLESLRRRSSQTLECSRPALAGLPYKLHVALSAAGRRFLARISSNRRGKRAQSRHAIDWLARSASAPASCCTRLDPLRRHTTPHGSAPVAALRHCRWPHTACVRFPGQQNSDWRGVTANLVPFPRLHFLTLSQAPLARNFAEQSRNLGPQGLMQELVSRENFLMHWDDKQARYLACAALFRGRLSMAQVDAAVAKANGRIASSGLVPDAVMRSVCDIPPPGFTASGTLVANHTAVARALARSVDKFRKMFKKRAFMHWYEGLTEADFAEAEKRTVDLVAEYIQLERQPKQASGVDEQW
uniref:Tubulin domain-containing protein n=1 Tax=Macrostomum lignano TaxID=282301 RepID=A0A1I8G8M0_9PLAT